MEKEDTEILSVMWDRAPLRVGDCLYLEPGVIKRMIKTKRREVVADLDENKDPGSFRSTTGRKATSRGATTTLRTPSMLS